MRSLGSSLLLCALPLLFSCGKAAEEGSQADYKDDAAWQTAEWNKCIEKCQAYLDPNVRKEEMRTLDAAYIAILAADNEDIIPFTTDGIPCEAQIRRGENQAEITVYRADKVVGIFSQDGDRFCGASAGLRMDANPLRADDEEVAADIVFSSEGKALATLKASGPLGCIEETLDLPAGISLRGSIAFHHLWETLRELTDAPTQDQAVPLVKKAASALHIQVFYEGDLSHPRGYLTMEPFHIFSRYDDYWSWTLVIRANNGTRVELENTDAQSLRFYLDFYKVWKDLMPHIIK